MWRGVRVRPDPVRVLSRPLREALCGMANLPGLLESNNIAVVVGPRLGHSRLAKSGVETLSQVLQVLLVAILLCEAWNADHGFASSKELARDILQRVHVAVVPGTDFGVLTICV